MKISKNKSSVDKRAIAHLAPSSISIIYAKHQVPFQNYFLTRINLKSSIFYNNNATVYHNTTH